MTYRRTTIDGLDIRPDVVEGLHLKSDASSLAKVTGGTMAISGTNISIGSSHALRHGTTVIVGTDGKISWNVLKSHPTITAGAGLSGGGSISGNISLAVDSTVVRTSGNQTIGGTKTFSSSIIGLRSDSSSDDVPFLILRNEHYGTNAGNVTIRMLATNADTAVNRGASIVMQRQNDGGTLHFKIGDGSGAPAVMSMIGTTGNVGIGATNPSAKLHVAGTSLFQGTAEFQSASLFKNKATFEHGNFGEQLSIKRLHASNASVITYENNSGIIGRAGFAKEGFSVYDGTNTDPSWRVSPTGELIAGSVPASRITGTLAVARLPTITHSMTDFANQALNTGSSPTFSTGTFSGNLDVSGYANIGSYGLSSSYTLRLQRSVGANGTRMGIQNRINISDGTLTSNRTHYGIANYVYNGLIDNSEFTTTQYGSYNHVRNSIDDNGVGNITNAYGSYNYIANYAADPEQNTIGTAYGSYNYIRQYRAGNTDTAIGVYSYIRRQAGAVGTGYLFRGIYSGTVGTKWGIYLTGETNNYFSGNVGIGTESPSYKLDVAGNVRFSGSVRWTGKLEDGEVPWARLSGHPSVTAGSGLSGGGALSQTRTLSVSFAGTGSATTVARSDHHHDNRYIMVSPSESQTIFYSTAASSTILKMASGATGNPLVIQNSSGSPVFSISPSGVISHGSIAWGSVTGKPSLVNSIAAGSGISISGSGTVTITNSDRGSAQSIFKHIRNTSDTNQFSASSNSDYIQFGASGIVSVAFSASNRRVTYSASLAAGTNISVSGNTISTVNNPTFSTSVTTPLLTQAGALTIQATGNNYVRINTNGSERVRVLGNGNVGIGTTSPSAKLHVAGSAIFDGHVSLANSNLTSVNHITIADPGPDEGIEWLGGSGWKIYESPDNLGNTGGNLQFVTGNTRRATLYPTGDMWVQGNLNVDGRVSALGYRFHDTRDVNDQPQDRPGRVLSLDFKYRNSVGSPPLAVSANDSYAHVLTVAGWDTHGGSGGWPAQLSVGRYGIGVRKATSATAWGAWWTTVMANPSGLVGVGTTSPEAPLHVIGDVRVDNGSIIFRQGSYQRPIISAPESDKNGMKLVIEGGGPTIVASGEAGGNSASNISVDTEDLYLLSDRNIRLISGIQGGWASRKEGITITDTGNVGIGTTSPQESVHAVGKAQADEGFKTGPFEIVYNEDTESLDFNWVA